MWERSDRMWERELARWDAERRAWDTREAQLLQQVADLQHQLFRLAQLNTQPGLVPPAEAPRAPAQLSAPAPGFQGQSYTAWEEPEQPRSQQTQQPPAVAPKPHAGP